MPKYNYRCSGCGEGFELYHSMFEIIDRCILCESLDVERKPWLSFTTVKKNSSGRLVKEFIENAKKEIDLEKKKLKEGLDD